jgi:hypothetical protein
MEEQAPVVAIAAHMMGVQWFERGKYKGHESHFTSSFQHGVVTWHAT